MLKFNNKVMKFGNYWGTGGSVIPPEPPAPTYKLYYEMLTETSGPTKVTTGIDVTEYPYLVVMFDFKISGAGAGGSYFNFSSNSLNTRDHTLYYEGYTSILETSTSQSSTIINSSCNRYTLDGRYNYFKYGITPRNYHNHAYLVNVSTGFMKVYFDKSYALNTTYGGAFERFEYWQTTKEASQNPIIKNITVYGFSAEEDATSYILNGSL